MTPIRLATALCAVAMFACDSDKLLTVTDPDVARPDALTGVSAIPTLRAGAIGDFGVAYNGANADVEQVHMSAMIADEFINTETFPTRIEIDQRAMSLTNTSLNTTFFDLTAGARVGRARNWCIQGVCKDRGGQCRISRGSCIGESQLFAVRGELLRRSAG